jgi:hypothetical protein
LDIRIYWLVFTGCRTKRSSGLWISIGFFKAWIQVLRIFGFTGFKDFRIFKVLDLVSVDLRILVSDLILDFGHLVFVDLVVLVC